MSHLNIWNELGISPTKNVREIKKAYAAKSKLVHPEEHPEEFQKLHDAYKAALDIANSNVSFSPPAIKAEQTEQKIPEAVHAPIKEEEHSLDFSKISKENKTDEETEPEQNFDFNDAIQRNSLRHDNEIMEKTEVVIKNINAVYYKRLYDREVDWINVFCTDDVAEIMHEPIFLKELCRFLNSHRVYENLANVIFKSFNLISITPDTAGEFEELYSIIVKARTEAYERLINNIKLCWMIIFLIVCFSFIFLANEMWFAIIIIMLFAMLVLLKISSLKKRKKNFYE